MNSDPVALLAAHGSPLYVYDAERVRTAFATFRAAFPYQPAEFHYAIVCNKNHFLVSLLHRLGCGIHANTPGDVHAALAAGVDPARIVYSGTNLDARDLHYLAAAGIRLNLDSLDQLRAAADHDGIRKVGLRLLIDDSMHPSRIGIHRDEIPEAIAVASAAGMRLTGLHMYAGTNTIRPERFIEGFDRLIASSDLLPDLDYLDLGGGFGVAYSDDRPPLELARVGHEVSERMSELSSRRGKPIRLLVEPGRVLVAEAGMLYMTVVSVKERDGRRYVGVDTTIGNIVVESVYHAHHRVESVSAGGEVLAIPTDVCGNTTHSRDFLARGCRLPILRQGDVLALRDVGAYGYAMSSHFLNRPRPAEVVLDGGHEILTTRRETFEDLLATQVRL